MYHKLKKKEKKNPHYPSEQTVFENNPKLSRLLKKKIFIFSVKIQRLNKVDNIFWFF